MKSFVILLAAILAMSVSSPSIAAGDASAEKVIAYYFHGSFRCATCTRMEKYARGAIEANYKAALTSGKLEFKTVNVEDKGNEHFVNDYQLYTKALILSLVKDGKEVRYKNLDKIWEYVRNKKRFSDYVTKEVAQFLEETP